MSFDGLVWFNKDVSTPYSFKNGKLTLHLGNMLYAVNRKFCEMIGSNVNYLVGGNTLFHLTFPLNTNNSMDIANNLGGKLFGNVELNIDYYVKDWLPNSKYSKMKFLFDELDYFIPSRGRCVRSLENNSAIFSEDVNEIVQFNFKYKKRKVDFVLLTFATTEVGHSSHSHTISELLLEFEETDDFGFICGLYRIVLNLFSFICNRRNVSIKNVELIAKYEEDLPNMIEGKIVQEKKLVTVSQYLYVIDNYSEEFEDKEIISKTINYRYFKSHLKELVEMIRDDKISIFSIHGSSKLKNLIDLNQSLHITAAFENYQRTFLPIISSESTIEFYEDIKPLIQNYADRQTDKKKKKKAISFIKYLSPVVPLKDKIIKTYKGYESWRGLKYILDEWFSGKVGDLAKVANDWRNELAHEKNEYQPDRRVVDSIRLVEHINYCIVLRQAGYSDEEIKDIILNILRHN